MRGKQKTHEEFIKEMQDINPDIEILGQYQKDNIKIKCKCIKCGNEWEAKPNNLLNGKGCPKCNYSHGEKILSNG